MLYRHLPKITNGIFSIIAPDFASRRFSAPISASAKPAANPLAPKAKPAPEDETPAVMKQAAEAGINAYYAGESVSRIQELKAMEAQAGFASAPWRIIAAPEGTSGEKLKNLLEEVRSDARTFVEVRIGNPRAALALQGNAFLTAARALLNDGKLAGIGFSAPFQSETLRTALESFADWDFCTLELNYLAEGPDSLLAEMASRGMAIFARDPLASGKLAQVPPEVHEIFRNATVPRRHDEWALRSLWERQEITAILIEPENSFLFGVRTILAETGRPNSLPSAELSVIRNAAAEFRRILKKS